MSTTPEPSKVSDPDASLDQLVEAQALNLADLFRSAKSKGLITPSSHYEGAPQPTP